MSNLPSNVVNEGGSSSRAALVDPAEANRLKRLAFVKEILFDLVERGITTIRVRTIYNVYVGSGEFRFGVAKVKTLYKIDTLFQNDEYHDSTHLEVPLFFANHPHPLHVEDNEQYQIRSDFAYAAIEVFIEDFNNTIRDDDILSHAFKIQETLFVDRQTNETETEHVLILPTLDSMSDELKHYLRPRKSLLRNRQIVALSKSNARTKRLNKKSERAKALVEALQADAVLAAGKGTRSKKGGRVAKRVAPSRKGKEVAK